MAFAPGFEPATIGSGGRGTHTSPDRSPARLDRLAAGCGNEGGPVIAAGDSEAATMRYPALDGLRAIAAYTVVISHFTNLTGVFGGTFGSGAGQIGVMLFFVISGFLMGRLYADTPWTLSAVAEFYRKRAARVLPLYLLLVLVSFAVIMAGGPRRFLYEIGSGNIWQHLFFIRGTGVLWTIPVEVQFYLVFPALWLLQRYVGRGIVVWLAFAAIFAFAVDWRTPVLIGHLPYFLAGLALAVVPFGPGSRAADIAFAGALCLYVLSMPQILGIAPAQLWDSPIYLLVGVTMVGTALASPFANRFLGSGLLKSLGDASYSAYLLHMPLLHLLMKSPLGQANHYVSLAIFLVATALVAWLSYTYIEKPTRRFIAGRGNTPAAA